MGFAAVDAVIETHFNSNFSEVDDVAWPNVELKPGVEYVRPVILHGATFRMDMGSSTAIYRYPGVFTVQIFAEINKGKGRAMRIADIIADIFRSQEVNGVHFYTPYVTVIGESDSYYQINVSCPFYMDQIQ